MEESSAPVDSHSASFKIIEAIKEHPVLYINDVKGIDIKLADFRQKVWQFIADDLQLDVNWMKIRWKNLRDTYCRIVKYKNKPDKGVRRKKWIYEDDLNFLTFPFEPNYKHQICEVTEEYLQLINSNTLTSEDLLQQLEDRTDENYDEFLEVIENKSNAKKRPNETATSQTVNKDVLAQQIEAKFRKIRPKGTEVQVQEPVKVAPILVGPQIEPPKKKRKTNDKNVTQTNVQITKMKNSLQLFFKNIAKTVKQLPEDLQNDVKCNICKVIADAELQSKREQAAKKLDPVHTLPKMLLIPCHMIDKIK